MNDSTITSTGTGTGTGASTDQFGTDIWQGATLDPARGHLSLPSAVVDELNGCVEYLRRNPLPVLALRPLDFVLSATHTFAASLRDELEQGCGFALVDRFDTQRWTESECIAAYWLLASCIARPVAQSHDGKLVYDVTDGGRPPGNGVRPDVTNAGQNYHTDNSYNHVPPHYVSLLCLRPSRSGGMSGIVNFGWAFRTMRERHPQLVERLFEPFFFDRQREHATNEVRVCQHPLFERDGEQLIARLSHRQVVNGYALAGEALDDRGCAALEALEAILNEDGAAKTFMFEAGQIQIINNRALGHCRTAFEDFHEAGRKRHLVRLWLRDSGAPGYGL
ncbi:MAG: alpha-ketoglutarate-dependent taurine dioxygenase [Gammaproteobacteria bacterium]|jgi:alpha-ketoglutarate-dependent taurine dioxygenase